MTLSYYFAHLNNSSSADFFRVRIISGSTTTTVLQELGAVTDDDAVWITGVINLSQFAARRFG